MKKAITVQFLLLTFAITYVSWGICAGFSLLGYSLTLDYWLYLPYLLGGWSPAIASYIVLKRNHRVTGFKEWLKNVFDVKRSLWMYLLMLLFALVYFMPQMLIGEPKEVQPLYMLALLMPLMLFMGGLEEAGWRYVLQPELETKTGYILFSLIFSVIWLVWHLPLFFIAGTGQTTMDIGLYAIGIVGLSFALSALWKVTKSVFLCVLLHCLVNAARSVFIFDDTVLGALVAAALLLVVSVFSVALYKRKNQAARA